MGNPYVKNCTYCVSGDGGASTLSAINARFASRAIAATLGGIRAAIAWLHGRTSLAMRRVLRHVLRNSLIPIVTLMAGLLPGMIAGSVFIETIFTIPGMGFLAFQSVIVRDYPMAMALFTIGGALSLAGILVADILLKAVDPRIDFAGMQG